MSGKEGGGKAAKRQQRLAAELRANLVRRKAQARARRAGEPDERPDGLAGGDVPDLQSARPVEDAARGSAEPPAGLD